VIAQEKESSVERAYAGLGAALGDADRVMAAAVLILAIFDDFYAKFCEYSNRAKRAFESRDPHSSINISKERLGLYTRYIAEHGPRIGACFPALSVESILWADLDRLFVAMIVDRYEADIAFSFAHSVRRNVNHGLWKPVAYSFPPPSKLRAQSMSSVHRRLPVRGRIDDDLLCAALQVPNFSVPFRDLKGDAQKIRNGCSRLVVQQALHPLPRRWM